ncbi:enoyl-CoA hydratase/isomerase family protein [Elstera cyanobacteriorum]|uniref:enoyl-CoA hydratase/isomerase family protein n=1 Tax=Elstera cyanobacteriorum TaxID=2022747 RepID=UPI0023532F29|nr:enoyl-CoA hydratase/isomerase family protein [Elstera cyanobacteriorum]MCK6442404.1 enoyl-CoA hydratase/isomerase family protein [Elstera cyanobacteriorum]
MTDPLVTLHRGDGGIATLTLNRPKRHNSLVPAMLETLLDVLGDLTKLPPRVLVLTGAGRSFSTGGDVAAFADVPRGQRADYAAGLVGDLHQAILAMIDLPCPVIARVQGPVTGGSLGLVLAADLVAMARGAFIGPYYVEVGFAPDGGWTALLPDRIGPARAGEIQLLNRMVTAEEAQRLGIAQAVTDPDGLDDQIAVWVQTLLGKQAQSLMATKRLLWPPERRAAVAAGLERERQSFLTLIDTAETDAGMTHFLGRAA